MNDNVGISGTDGKDAFGLQNLSSTKRVYQLDSIRGLAALTVLIFHGFNITDIWHHVPRIILHSPLRVLWEGPQAVIIFFLLSGYVLSLTWYKPQTYVGYRSFLVRRVCRIYIPYIGALIIALFARVWIDHGAISGDWGGSVSTSLVVHHLILIDSFNQTVIDPVVWSLVHEMRISIIFPFLMMFVTRFNWKISLTFTTVLGIIGIGLHYAFQTSVDPLTNYFDTLVYLVMFVVGALMAKHQDTLVSKYQSRKSVLRICIIASGVFLYAYSNSVDHQNIIALKLVSYFVTTAGGSVFILVALGEPLITKLLLLNPIRFFGKISYSLYFS